MKPKETRYMTINNAGIIKESTKHALFYLWNHHILAVTANNELDYLKYQHDDCTEGKDYLSHIADNQVFLSISECLLPPRCFSITFIVKTHKKVNQNNDIFIMYLHI